MKFSKKNWTKPIIFKLYNVEINSGGPAYLGAEKIIFCNDTLTATMVGNVSFQYNFIAGDCGCPSPSGTETKLLNPAGFTNAVQYGASALCS